MTIMDEQSLLTFPCDLPIKVLGLNAATFRAAAVSIVRSHYTALEERDVAEQLSREGKYLSLTITVRAENRAQIDAVYRELTASDEVLMVL
jgi:putative lipoic acid-binding regulatory protein